MNSTIQIKKDTKEKLKELKTKKTESYESVIEKLIDKELVIREKLKEGYKAKYKESEEINKEWENADSTWR